MNTYQKSIGKYCLNISLTEVSMTDGEKLKQFIDNQAKSKISIAKGLNISKQTLFQYFKSITLENETKKKLEKFFGKQIFTPNGVSTTTDHQQYIIDISPPQSALNSMFIREIALLKSKLLVQALDAYTPGLFYRPCNRYFTNRGV